MRPGGVGSLESTPALSAWGERERPLRLIAQAVAQDDPDPQALACDGLLVRQQVHTEQRTAQVSERLWLRFVDGRPVSAATGECLGWCCTKLAAAGGPGLGLVWDNAGWHSSHAVRNWLRAHNRAVKRTGQGVRLLVC